MLFCSFSPCSVWLVSFGSVVRAMLAGHLDQRVMKVRLQAGGKRQAPEVTPFQFGRAALTAFVRLEPLALCTELRLSQTFLDFSRLLKPQDCLTLSAVRGCPKTSNMMRWRSPWFLFHRGKGSVDLLQVSATEFTAMTKVGSASENVQPVRGDDRN